MVASAFIGAGASILGGILGRKSEKKAAARNRANEIEDARVKFQRLRESAELGGFNPLTALQTTGGAGFSFSGGNVAPLASIQMITGGIADAAQAFSSDEALRRKTDQLKYDLAKVQLDQVKAQVKAQAAVNAIGGKMPSLGKQPKRTQNVAAQADLDFYTLGETPEDMPPTSAPILTKGRTIFGDIYYPGQDGEPWGIDELMTAAISVPLNVALGGMKRTRDWVDTKVPKLRFPSIDPSTKPVRVQPQGYQTHMRNNFPTVFD